MKLRHPVASPTLPRSLPMLRRLEAVRAFASTHAARYLQSPVQRRRPELQCLRSPVWTVTQLVRQYRFGLTLASSPERRGKVDRPAAAAGWRREIERVLVAAPPPTVTHHEQVVRRLLRRFESALELVRSHERVISTSAGRRESEPEVARRVEARPGQAVHMPAEPALPALPLARRAPAADTAPTVSGSEKPRVHALPPSATARAVNSAAPIAEHEIERLADRVIGSIDRRLIAQRERMGSH